MRIEVGLDVKLLQKDYPPEINAAEFLLDVFVSRIEKRGRNKLIDLSLSTPPYPVIYRTTSSAIRKGEDDNCLFYLKHAVNFPKHNFEQDSLELVPELVTPI